MYRLRTPHGLQHQATETMRPMDQCMPVFYDCAGCGTRLKPDAFDCCVFCSYGTVPCPTIQANGKWLRRSPLEP
ncbi:GDCCVxC domain-containing (seleno)protein [Bradyrhizobium sp. OAE829]|uniref:GDCCVxC domain-containing (seleno)protein n=1 Tax=Bradyrhizobium sp. OAE829 TaxID=2663807 RepID=UPI0033970DAB